MIFGERVKQIRELSGLTQEELALRLEVTQPYVAQIEGQRTKPSDDFMSGMVFQFGFPLSFYEQSPTEDFPLGSLLFCGRNSMTDREQRELYRWAQVAYDIYNRMIIGRNVREVPLHIPRCKDSPEVAASITRNELGLSPDCPIPNVINTLEKAGVLVLSLPGKFEGRDAFSLWATGVNGERRPIVAMVADRPADRLRMSISHELGHLVMHQPLTIGVGDVEKQATQFAGNFLLPAAGMRHDLAPPVTLETFVNLKTKWRVSIQALIVRAHELNIISPRKYHYLFSKLAARGWRQREPLSLDVPLERPRAYRQTAELIYGFPIKYHKMAADVRVHEPFIRQIVELHAGKARGGAPDVTAEQTPKQLKPSSRSVVSFPVRPKEH